MFPVHDHIIRCRIPAEHISKQQTSRKHPFAISIDNITEQMRLSYTSLPNDQYHLTFFYAKSSDILLLHNPEKYIKCLL